MISQIKVAAIGSADIIGLPIYLPRLIASRLTYEHFTPDRFTTLNFHVDVDSVVCF